MLFCVKLLFYFLIVFSCFGGRIPIFCAISHSETCESLQDFIKKFNPRLLHILDYNEKEEEKVFLVRGNIPIIGGKFCYDLLKNKIKEVIIQSGVSIRDNFKIVDVSLLGYSAEDQKFLQIEKDWFSHNPDTGLFIHKPILGISTNVLSIEPSFHKLLANTNIDGLRELIYTLKEIMHISLYPGEDTVIYIHCTAGKDRTGEVSAAYLMQNKNLSYIQVTELNREIAGRDVYIKQANAICLYALYLRNIKNCSWIGPILEDNSNINLDDLSEN